jgi:glucose/arabinose dehydrogenase
MSHQMVKLLLIAHAVALAAITAPAEVPSAPGQHAAAGREVGSQQERDWVDNRWSRTEVGPFLASNIEAPGGKIAKALSIKVGEHDAGTVCYDTATCALRAVWLGGFLKFDPARFGLIIAPKIQGDVAFSLGTNAGWSPGEVRYAGLHLNGQRGVLEYHVGGMRVLESPWLETVSNLQVFSRTFELGPSPEEHRLVVSSTFVEIALDEQPTAKRVNLIAGSTALALALQGPGASLVANGNNVVMTIPAHDAVVRFKLFAWSGPKNDVEKFARAIPPSQSPEDLDVLVDRPGPARWLPELRTTGQRGLDSDILSIDTLTVPYDNPWKALMFLAGVDFTPNGAAYVCSIHGDVWRVTGIDDQLRELKWKRFATGLFQPLGLKVRDGEVFVLGRDQITKLRDLNGDGEADFYENFCNLIATSTGGHDYVTSLEQDASGNFYYVDPEGVHRISPDGHRKQTLATGFRHANGVGVSADGQVITVAPQQGEWTPSSEICEIKNGGYYGYGGPKVTLERTLGYDSPLCWIPHSVDNSSGSQVWIPQNRWGPLGGHMLHLLWGRCGLMFVLRDVVGQIAQGAVVPLPGRFLSGPNRGSFNPRDGHLYVAGSTGWQTSAAKDGSLQRVRFTGKPAYLPVAWHASSNGLAITFAQPLDASAAEDVGSYAIRQWNYHYAAQYGSKDWSVADPRKEGRDDVTVKSARLLSDHQTIFLEIPGLQPVMQMELKYSLSAADGKPMRNQLWLTLNKLDAVRP